MGVRSTAWVVLLVAGVLTYAIRGSFLLFADRFSALSSSTREVLRMIPPAALAALVAPALLRPDGAFVLVSPQSLAGIIALGVAWRTRNVLLTILVGLAAVIGIGLLFD